MSLLLMNTRNSAKTQESGDNSSSSSTIAPVAVHPDLVPLQLMDTLRKNHEAAMKQQQMALSTMLTSNKLQAPQLKNAEVDNIRNFCVSYKRYVAKGGALDIRLCIADNVLESLAYFNSVDDVSRAAKTDEEIFALLTTWSRPRDLSEFVRRMSTIKMATTDIGLVTSIQVQEYLAIITSEIDILDEAYRAQLGITPKLLLDSYLAGLPPKLKDFVKKLSPATLEAAVKATRDKALQLEDAIRHFNDMGLMAHLTRSPPRFPHKSFSPVHENHGQKRKFEDIMLPGHPVQSGKQIVPAKALPPGHVCFNCGGSHSLSSCPLPHDDIKISAAKAAFIAAKSPNKPIAGSRHNKPSGERFIACQRLELLPCSDVESISTCMGILTVPTDVDFMCGKSVCILRDSCCTDTLVSLSLCREIGVQLGMEAFVDIVAWDGSISTRKYFPVTILCKINHLISTIKPLVFKLECRAVEMASDLILSQPDLLRLDIENYLTTSKHSFPWAQEVSISPEENAELEFGFPEAFPLLSDTGEVTFVAPEYVVDKLFPLLPRLLALLAAHNRVFTPRGEGMRCEPMYIDLCDGAVIRKQYPRNVPPAIQGEIDAEVDRWLREGIVRPSMSSVAAPVVPVRKADGTIRVCIDYRNLNEFTIAVRHPLPRIEDCLKRMAGKQFFAKMDLRWGFNQLDIREDCKHLTAFVTKKGLYEFNRTPFGLKNASSIFQRRVEDVLIGIAGVAVFIDDILVFGDTADEFLLILDQVLTRLGDAGVVVKASKCTFGSNAIEYLGHIVDNVGIRLSSKRVQAVLDLPAPKNAQAVRRFLGVANAFRDYIPDYASLSSPLRILTGRT